MYNLLEYSDNYSMTLRRLWNYCRDEVNDDDKNENDNAINSINNNETVTSKSSEYKKKIIAEVAVPLKYLSNFLRFLDLPLISCEI